MSEWESPLRMRRRLRFLREFARNPRATGAVTQSSRYLSRRMIAAAALAPGETVAEYGPGNGATTRRLIEYVNTFPEGTRPRMLAVEINEGFAHELKKRHPALSLHVGCASRIAEYLAVDGLDGLDAVISGLPWSVFPESLQDALLDGMLAVLRPGGRFVTFAYLQGTLLPAGRRFREKIDARFHHVDVSRPVWRNIPPALVYCCRTAPAEKA